MQNRKIINSETMFKRGDWICAVAYTQKIFMGGFIQWHMVVICIWCVLFVTSQFDVMFMFPSQRFREVVDTTCILFYTHSPYFTCHCTECKLQYQRSKLDIRGEYTQRYDTAVHNCKNIRLRVKTGE